MSDMIEFAHHYFESRDVLLHYVTCGSGPPVVLLHGWPQTWYAWRRVMPYLARNHSVIVPDLRGLGDSSRPLTGYDKRTVADDIWQLVEGTPGHDPFHLVGHDWGGAVAFALAAAHPTTISSLAIIDIVIPGGGGDLSQAGRRWHPQFHMTPDLPEALVQGRERIYLQWFFQTSAYYPCAVDDDALDEYVRTYSQPGAMRSGFEYYRAIEQDTNDNSELLTAGFRLPMPVLAVGGAVSYPHGRGRGAEVEVSMMRVAENVRGAVIADCGHLVPEEKPKELSALLLDFFR